MKWIDVNEQLPPVRKKVMVAIKSNYSGFYHQSFAEYIPKFSTPVEDYMHEDYDDGDYDEATDEYYAPEGWYEQQYEPEINWMIVSGTVTHWMPMIENPQTQNTNEKSHQP